MPSGKNKKNIRGKEMSVPTQLQDQDFRFVKVAYKNKRPIEDDWTTINCYPYWHPKFVLHQNKRVNYGVLGGAGGLIIIDFDNKEFQNKIEPQLPKTFTVKSGGKGLFHIYLTTNDTTSFKVLNEKEETLCDVQGNGKQVVGPGSIHESGRTYEVIRDIPIQNISGEQLHKIFDPYKTVREKNRRKKSEKKDSKRVNELAEQGLTVPVVLQALNVPMWKNPTTCPFHSSVNEKCLSYTDKVWHCFHCNREGHVGNLLFEARGLL